MLKRTLLLTLVATIFIGCMAKRQVLEGNLFQSPMPSMTIEMDSKLSYLGNIKAYHFDNGIDDARTMITSEQHEIFYFAEIGRNNKIERFLLLKFGNLVEPGWYYIDQFYQNWENAMQLGTVEFGNRRYKTAYTIDSIKGGDISKYFNSKSYFPAECYAIKVLHRFPDETNSVLIWFAESCERLGPLIENSDIDDAKTQSTIIKALDERFDQALISR